MRLIDADALLKTHCNECTLYPNDCLGDDCDNGAVIHIKESPTVDAVPVIRCKDCKHHKGYNCDRLYGMQDAFTVMDDDYCSHPERRDDDHKR